MADRFTGVWNGENVSFPKEWRGVTLTDTQCEDLLAGKVIEVVGLTSQRTGNPYGVTAKLGHLVSKTTGNKYVGIEQVDFLPRETLVAHGVKFPVPRSFCQHEFTEDERIMLESGRKVKIDNAYSKKNDKYFSCTVHYDEAEQRIVFDNDK